MTVTKKRPNKRAKTRKVRLDNRGRGASATEVAVRRQEGYAPVKALAAELGMSHVTLYSWFAKGVVQTLPKDDRPLVIKTPGNMWVLIDAVKATRKGTPAADK